MTTPGRPPAGDVTPIPVRLTAVEDGVSLGPAPAPGRKKIVTEYTTVAVGVGGANMIRPVLPAAPNRIRAIIMVASVIGGGASNSSYGWLADTYAKAQKAAQVSDGSIGAYITASNTAHAPFTVYGQNALWVAQDLGSGTAMVLTVIADYEAED